MDRIPADGAWWKTTTSEKAYYCLEGCNLLILDSCLEWVDLDTKLVFSGFT